MIYHRGKQDWRVGYRSIKPCPGKDGEISMDGNQVFRNRKEAGTKLAKILKDGTRYDMVLGIPRGGLEVAAPISKELGIPLDVIVVRKLPIPWSPEAGFGAVTDDKSAIYDAISVRGLGLSEAEIAKIVDEVYAEVLRRKQAYRGDRPDIPLQNKSVLIVDDGLATGYTMLAAVRSAKKKGASVVTVAVPVAAHSARKMIEPEADEFMALIDSSAMPFAVAMFYLEWRDLTDLEVYDLLGETRTASGD